MYQPTVQIVDTDSAIKAMLNDLRGLPTNPPSLYLDLEGTNLSRHGSLSILQLHIPPRSKIYIVDIHRLGNLAFTTASSSWPTTTFRSILEDPATPKAFFDCRNDSDALHAHFGIALRGVVDIQLMEVATRARRSKSILQNLGTLIQSYHVGLPKWRKDANLFVERHGKALWAPERGGSFEVFDQRPMRLAILDYCVQGVVFLPVLWARYDEKIGAEWAEKVEVETSRRVEESRAEDFPSDGKWKKFSPWE